MIVGDQSGAAGDWPGGEETGAAGGERGAGQARVRGAEEAAGEVEEGAEGGRRAEHRGGRVSEGFGRGFGGHDRAAVPYVARCGGGGVAWEGGPVGKGTRKRRRGKKKKKNYFHT
jgi:hypothetical protein